MNRRVVITGLGVLSPVGLDVESFWDSITAGRSGIGVITRFDPEPLPVRIAGELPGFDPLQYIDRKEAKRMDRFCQYAVAAASMALADADLKLDPELSLRAAVILGTGVGGIETFVDQQDTYRERGPARVSPFFIPMMIANMAAGQIAMTFGAKGHNSTVVTACAASAHAIGEAFRVVSGGHADVAITGGAEAPILPLTVSGFASMRAVSTRNDDPTRASRPFDADRDGFVLAEGAAILVLEDLKTALARGARIYGEVLGYGSTCDAYHISAPDPEGDGGARAMAAALADAKLMPEQVDYINAHGTSTPLNDRLETTAIKRVFGEHSTQLAISSTKSMTGHLLGAAGAIEAVAVMLTLTRGVIPPTINLDTPDPECDLDYVARTARQQDVRVALSNSFGFGGQNACLALGRWDEK